MRKSIRKRFTVFFILAVFFIMMITWGLNSFFIEKYYRKDKIEAIKSAYTAIDEEICGKDGYEIEKLDAILEDRSEADNISIAVVDTVRNVSIISSERDREFILQNMRDSLFDRNREGISKVLEENSNYRIILTGNEDSNFSSIECVGYCSDNSTMVIMSTPMESLRQSARVSNRFLTIAGLITLVLGGITMSVMTDQVTRPMRRLSALSEKLRDMDFSERYVQGKNQDELDTLGSNMNIMADRLDMAISALQEANIKLKKELDEKTEQEKLRQEFIADVSHELKTPIALIQGYAEGLSDGLCEDEESRKYYSDVIVDEAGKMNNIVRQLISLSQMESGDTQLDMTEFDMSILLSNIADNFKVLADRKQAVIECSIPVSAPVYADEMKTESVINNLLSNAVNYVKEGGRISISLYGSQNDPQIYICEVYNDGEHISDEDLSRIWDKFYKADKARSRAYGGTGIGLAYVKAILDAHGASYEAVNVNNGVLFRITVKKANI